MPRAIEHDGVVALRESLSLGKAMIFICQHCTLISERCKHTWRGFSFQAFSGLADSILEGEIRWIELVEDVEDIVREIVKLLIEELTNEIVSLENF